ncbi:GGDEF domain-containing protein [Cohnella yongneupensis]|uniref:GGDEF domain-containing protein n=1 Tax=Cohnella yongneupensis TaxID=425006 RepID=A0ABW0R1F1_9BACL
MNLLPLLIVTVTVSITGAFLRFYFSAAINKLMLCASALILLMALDTTALETYMPIIGSGFVLLLSYSYFGYGALVSVIIVGWLMPAEGGYSWSALTGTVIAGFAGMILSRQQRKQRESDKLWQEQLYKQSRPYSILKEVSVGLQSTMDTSKLLHIILTAITAGYGHGFNRALLFLFDERGNRLKGELGVGSMNNTDGIRIWNTVVNDRMNLRDFIARKDEANIQDYQLNDALKLIDIPQTSADDHVIHRAIREQKPYLVREIDSSDAVQQLFSEMFGMTSFAVVPMINQDKAVGVIIVDNNINRKPLDIDGVDSILPLAAQACIAIENSRLYERTQRLSITDGLTGLYNQRFYQDAVQRYVLQAEQEGMPLSLIMLDIDNFKRYNDTNGHLEGNNLLIVLGRLIASVASDRYVPCRFGGEEFVVLLPDASLAEASRVAEEIKSAVESYAFHNGQAQPGGKVTISGGAAAYRPGMSVALLMDAADRALYEAKRTGKNRIVMREEGANAV